jgi:hypothetical protein
MRGYTSIHHADNVQEHTSIHTYKQTNKDEFIHTHIKAHKILMYNQTKYLQGIQHWWPNQKSKETATVTMTVTKVQTWQISSEHIDHSDHHGCWSACRSPLTLVPLQPAIQTVITALVFRNTNQRETIIVVIAVFSVFRGHPLCVPHRARAVPARRCDDRQIRMPGGVANHTLCCVVLGCLFFLFCFFVFLFVWLLFCLLFCLYVINLWMPCNER